MYLEEVSNLNIQQQIESKIQQSFVLRKELTRLLEIDKQTLEMAIEQDANVAIIPITVFKWTSDLDR